MTELKEIMKRDAESGALWFTGPASFTAQAARDRRALLAMLKDTRELLLHATAAPLPLPILLGHDTSKRIGTFDRGQVTFERDIEMTRENFFLIFGGAGARIDEMETKPDGTVIIRKAQVFEFSLDKTRGVAVNGPCEMTGPHCMYCGGTIMSVGRNPRACAACQYKGDADDR